MIPVTKPTAAQDSVWLDRVRQILAPQLEPVKKSEPEAARPPFSRRAALAALVGGGAAAATLVTPGTAASQARPPQKVDDASAFVQILVHEDTHVRFLQQVLGNNARPVPTFQNLEMPNFTSFVLIAQIFENLGSGAYLGAAPFIKDRAILAQAGRIGVVEARQAGWLNNALGNPILGSANKPAQDRSFEDPISDDEVAGVGAMFIASLNGGPPLSYENELSDANDLRILNFAYGQELLEQQFYLVNVNKFFGPGGALRR